MVSTGGDLWVKQGTLSAPLQRIARGASDVALSGSRIAFVDTSGQLWPKDGAVDAAWRRLVRGGSSNVELNGDRLLLRTTSGRLWLKVGPYASPRASITSGAQRL